MATKVEQIIEDYKKMLAVAKEITEAEVKDYPIGKREIKFDRVTHHFLDMIAMYQNEELRDSVAIH